MTTVEQQDTRFKIATSDETVHFQVMFLIAEAQEIVFADRLDRIIEVDNLPDTLQAQILNLGVSTETLS